LKIYQEKKNFFWKKVSIGGSSGWQRNGEWRWLGGSGINRKRRSVRFEWYKLECGSGSIGGDMAVKKISDN
jgi:hypothetical protein